MKPNTVRMALDLYGTPFIVDACTTDGDDTGKIISTYDFMQEEISNCGYADVFSTIEESGIYKVISNYDNYPDFILLKSEEKILRS